ncbi:MAG: DsbE family thiol:disulfide interchange protein [Betaproteobacteria bacterium]|nr:DsbE family thiol:disulfide interchange protein [Betaproteobacteria bacterium]
MSEEAVAQTPSRKFHLVPLGIFILLCMVLAAGLRFDPKLVASPLIDKQAPHFSLPVLARPDESVSPESLRGKPWVLNVWASWCTACLQEHPLIVDLLAGQTTLVGLNYKDAPSAARSWLDNWGDPYTLSVIDQDGQAGFDWGVYGVPETFVIDERGLIRYKHIGPLTRAAIKEDILPLLRRLQANSQT